MEIVFKKVVEMAGEVANLLKDELEAYGTYSIKSYGGVGSNNISLEIRAESGIIISGAVVDLVKETISKYPAKFLYYLTSEKFYVDGGTAINRPVIVIFVNYKQQAFDFNYEEYKDFNLITRDGRSARMLGEINADLPLVAAVLNEKTGEEEVVQYFKTGKYEKIVYNDLDLFMTHE